MTGGVAMSQGVRTASRSWKEQENEFSEPSEGPGPGWNLALGQVKIPADCWLQDGGRKNGHCFHATEFLAICLVSTGKVAERVPPLPRAPACSSVNRTVPSPPGAAVRLMLVWPSVRAAPQCTPSPFSPPAHRLPPGLGGSRWLLQSQGHPSPRCGHGRHPSSQGGTCPMAGVQDALPVRRPCLCLV